MTDELRLFDEVVDAALGEPLEARMRDYAIAVARRDGERVRLIDDMIRAAVMLGTHTLIAKRSRRD